MNFNIKTGRSRTFLPYALAFVLPSAWLTALYLLFRQLGAEQVRSFLLNLGRAYHCLYFCLAGGGLVVLVLAWRLACILGRYPRLWRKGLRNLLAVRKPLIFGLLLTAAAFMTLRCVAFGPFCPYYTNGKSDPDCLSIAFQARTFAEGKLWQPDPGPSFEAVNLISYEDKTFSKYPPFTAAYYALSLKLFHTTWPFQVLVPLLTALFAGLVAELVFGRLAGLLAVPIVLLNGEMLLHGPTLRSNPLSALLVIIALYAALGIARNRRYAPWILVGVLVCEFNNRPLDALVLTGSLLLFYWALRRETSPAAPKFAKSLAFGTLAGIAVIFYFNWLYTGSFLLMPYKLYSYLDGLGFGLRRGSLYLPALTYTPSEIFNNMLEDTGIVHEAFGYSALIPLLAGLGLLWRKRARRSLPVLLAVLCGVLLYGLYYYPSSRYGFFALPVAGLLLAAVSARSFRHPLLAAWIALWLMLHLGVAAPLECSFARLSPVAEPAELELLASAQDKPALVFLSPPTTYAKVHGMAKPTRTRRQLGRPVVGLGSLPPNWSPKAHLVIALDRGPVLNASVIKRFPQRRVFLAVYDRKERVRIESYKPTLPAPVEAHFGKPTPVRNWRWNWWPGDGLARAEGRFFRPAP